MPVGGSIAYYGNCREGPGPVHLPGFMRTIMSKGLEVRGFGGAMVGGTAALEQLGTWVRDGRIRHPEVIVDGLNAAPAPFAGIFAGNRNVGKWMAIGSASCRDRVGRSVSYSGVAVLLNKK